MNVVHATRQVWRPAEKTAEKKTTRQKKLLLTFMQTRDQAWPNYFFFYFSKITSNLPENYLSWKKLLK